MKKKEEKKEGEEKTPAVNMAVVEASESQVPVNFKSKLTRQQIEIIKTQIAKGSTDDELKMFLFVCERTGLDPFTKQVHLVPRWDSKLGREVRTVIVGIDGLRSIAEKTEAYAGNSDPIFDGEIEIEYTENVYEGKTKKETKKSMIVPEKATVTVKKIVQGVICDFTATAKWTEYYPGDKGGIMWRKMPANMLGKCAEAKALRKAFPAVMSGLYVAEEMHQAGVQNVASNPQVRQATLFTKVKTAVEKITDKKELEEKKAQFESSDKYTDDQKSEIISIIDKKLQSLQ